MDIEDIKMELDDLKKNKEDRIYAGDNNINTENHDGITEISLTHDLSNFDYRLNLLEQETYKLGSDYLENIINNIVNSKIEEIMENINNTFAEIENRLKE